MDPKEQAGIVSFFCSEDELLRLSKIIRLCDHDFDLFSLFSLYSFLSV